MVYRLVARDTIEEKVIALKARKARLFSSVLNDGKPESASAAAGPSLEHHGSSTGP
jgi:SNF2 family DNA or RNA helicase